MTAHDKQPINKGSHEGPNKKLTEKTTKKTTKKSKTIDDLICEKTEKFKVSATKKPTKRTRKVRKVQKTFSDLMGPPPLLSDEDPAQYFALYEMLRLKLEPRDILEEFLALH